MTWLQQQGLYPSVLDCGRVIQYGYEANAKEIRAAQRDSEKDAADTRDAFTAIVAKAIKRPSRKIAPKSN